MGDRVVARLDATVVFANCLNLLDFGGRRGFEIAFDVAMERRLVVLEANR
jgi:hypothetical protein